MESDPEAHSRHALVDLSEVDLGGGLPADATLDELLALGGACPCVNVGSLANPYSASSVIRGNIYRIDPDGPPRTLCNIGMYLNAPAGTTLCFYVFRCSSACTSSNSSYTEVWSGSVAATAGGMKLYSAPPSFPPSGIVFQPNEKLAVAVAWGATTVTYGRDAAAYPNPGPEFGSTEGSFGKPGNCGMTSPQTLSLYASAVYAQQICFKPPPGACCVPGAGCQDTHFGEAMDEATCVSIGGEFTKPTFTCADLAAMGGCGWVAANQGACCLETGCQPTQSGEPMNPLLCEYRGIQLGGSPAVFHAGTDCASDICNPRGPCCLFDGTCQNYLAESECVTELGGVWTDPIANPNAFCPDPQCVAQGACCIPGHACEEHTQLLCESLGGPEAYLGDGVHCDAGGLACQTATGACCYLDLSGPAPAYGCIGEVTQFVCEVLAGGGATWVGGQTCASIIDDCTARPVIGACCRLNTTTFQVECMDVEDADCFTTNGYTKIAYKPGQDCSIDGICRTDLGACCTLSGCLAKTASECASIGGEFTMTTGGIDSCDGIVCTKGACCSTSLPTGCELTDEAGCIGLAGTFAGVGAPCGWACATGACCFGQDVCSDESQVACLNAGGDFAGTLTVCGTAAQACKDCNTNGAVDAWDIANGVSLDCNLNGAPDECDSRLGTSHDCNTNGTPDECETDCNANGFVDSCDIATGTSLDVNTNGTPDECEHDCNSNGIEDLCDINCLVAGCNVPGCGQSADCNDDAVPDSCELAAGTGVDCQLNGIPDSCDIAAGTSADCQTNGVPDSCDLAGGTSPDVNANGIPDECEPAHLINAAPADRGTLWRTARNIIRLTFDRDIAAPPAGQVVIEQLLDGGAFGADLSAGFTFAVENDPNQGNQPRILTIRENATSVAHRTWYSVRHAGSWIGVDNFEVQYVVLMGDVDNNGFVQNLDAGAIYPNVSPLPKPDNYPYDVDGNGVCQNLDAGGVFPRISPLPKPTKPTGH